MTTTSIIMASLGIALGLTVVALVAVTAGSRRPVTSPGPRAVFAAAMTYVVVVAPLFAVGGFTLVTWVVLVVLVCAAVAAAYAAAHGRGGTLLGGRAVALRPVLVATSAGVTIGLVAVLLIAAGQSMSLVARVNPAASTVVVAVVATLVALANGVRGTARAGRWLFWVIVATCVPIVAAGLFVGRPGDLVAPVIPVEGPSPAGLAAIAVTVVAVGFTDPALGDYVGRSPGRSTAWGAALVAVVLLAAGIGLLLVFGGVLIAPSLAFFTLPANLWAVPGAMVAAMFVLTFLLATTIASLASGAVARARPSSDDTTDSAATVPRRSIAWAAGIVGLATVIALLPTTAARVVYATALVATAGGVTLLVASTRGPSDRTSRPIAGLVAGVVAAVVALVLVVVTGADPFGLTGLLGLVATGVVAAAGTVLARAGHERQQDTVPTGS